MNTLINAVETTVTNNVVLNDAIKPSFNAGKTLANLESKRINWENGTYRTSNQELYGLLAECLAYAGNDVTFEQAKERSAALEAFFKSRGYKYDPKSPLITKVVRAVFGNIDRRRTSGYSLVLRQAIKEKVLAINLSVWIEERGGIQEIRLGRSATFVSPTNKASIGKEIADSKVLLGNAKSELLSFVADAQYMGQMCVLIAEQQSNGSFDIKAVVRSAGALNAAYSGLYSQQKESMDKARKEVTAANDADGAIAKQA